MLRAIVVVFWTTAVAAGVELPDGNAIFDQISDALKVPYNDFLKNAQVFKVDDLQDYRPIVVDAERQQIVIGARDVVLRLKDSDLSLVERLDWSAADETRALCQMKGRSEADCHNFVRTIVLYEDKLLLCGTNAYSPACTWRKISDLSTQIGPDFDGLGTTPFSPHYHNTYVMTEGGQLFSGVATDTMERDASFLRILPASQVLSTDKANDRWLNDPQFVHSFEADNFVYFFFRESAVEQQQCGEKTTSRVARVCKNDAGGVVLLQKSWTTFNKATLNCSTDDGRQFDQLEAVYEVPDSRLVYAVFTTVGSNVLPGSAICVYDRAAFRAAFAGSYLYQSNPSAPWVRHPNNYKYFDCEVQGIESANPGKTTKQLVDAQRYQLMADAVQPIRSLPIHTAIVERYLKVVVDTVRVKNYGQMQVIFALTESGLLKKFSVLPEEKNGGDNTNKSPFGSICLVEVVQVASPSQPFEVTDFRLLTSMNALLIGTKKALFRIATHRCDRLRTKEQCIDAEDPYCGWDSKQKRCTTPPNGVVNREYWHQKLDGCPKVDAPVDGAFGAWSPWMQCPLTTGFHGENCHCRTRECDSPKPRMGGTACQGPSIEVTNCTQHGQWTAWSDWSACSATCGVSSRTRRRTCANPAPAFGGRTCVGADVNSEYCKQTACPLLTEPPIDGGWSGWSSWAECSKRCGGGIQKRTRQCNNPTPANQGRLCVGCDQDYRVCNTEPCEETRRWSEWTPWMTLANLTKKSDGASLQRFKFACGARIEDPRLVSVSRASVEEKFCQSGTDDCTGAGFTARDGGWSDWTQWSECSQRCDNGTQSRLRTCTNPSPSGSGSDCEGHAKEVRQCNAHSCFASWSCWGDFSECSVTCGQGVKHRVRNCERQSGTEMCKGDRVETIPCNAGPCSLDGYGDWSGWSSCSELGVKVRIRPCLSVSYCDGLPDAQMKRCSLSDGDVMLDYSSSPEGSSLILVGAIVGAFCLGILFSVGIACYAVRRRSNCCYGFSKKSQTPSTGATSRGQQPPLKSNIYTPPPIRTSYRPSSGHVAMQRMSTATSDLGIEGKTYAHYELADFDDSLWERDSALTLSRTMRASLNKRDYL